ncbi:MAG: hypothetical protein EA405_01025 [Rhodospirillales bacterium]|nr:MAG: hypothetical protein EA405_01025 [Rhodospirillales bacterium]
MPGKLLLAGTITTILPQAIAMGKLQWRRSGAEREDKTAAAHFHWQRFFLAELDLNLRPSGYEVDSLCAAPWVELAARRSGHRGGAEARLGGGQARRPTTP